MMVAPATPGQEGPSYGPPPLPQGWIAQWDGTSKKYYFVQLSTGASQWETPTQAAPTVGTPTPTPGQEDSPFPQPGQQEEGEDGERGFASMAVNELIHSQAGGHSGKPSNPLLSMAGELFGGGHNSHQTSSSGGAGIVGALAGSLLGGNTKPNQGPQPSYSGQTPQGAYGQQQDGIMGKIGNVFGGANAGHQSNFGYSENGQHQGGYTGQAPPSSYQPAGSQNTQGHTGPAPSSSYQSANNSNTQGYTGSASSSSYQGSSGTGTYYSPQQQQQQQQAYGQGSQGSPQIGVAPQFNAQQQSYPPNSQSGPNSGPGSYYNSQQSQQQPMYGTQNQQQSQPGYGGVPQQQHQQQQQQQPPYGSDFYSPIYIGPGNGNLQQPQHQSFPGFHHLSHQGGLYGDQGGPPQPPMGSHPNRGQGYTQGQGGQHEMQGYGRGRW